MEKSESIKNIAIALCKFQGDVETIRKTATNPFFKSKYADLADILNVIRQPLVKNELSFVQFPKGKYGLETMLMHSSGEWISEWYEMTPTKNDPQNAGSVITYQRRYALGAILGLNIDIDDDGNKGSESQSEPKKESKKEVLTPEHKNWSKVVDYLKGDGIMTEVLKKYTISNEVETQLMESIL
jgi:hypothetical protein